MESSSPLGHSTPPVTLPDEAHFYYSGLPSCPVLVSRTSTITWNPPTGPEAYQRPKVLETVGRHPITEIWEENLSSKIVQHLDSLSVAWTTIDVVRISYVEEATRPVILWIGVQPKSLSPTVGKTVADGCKTILVQAGILNVDVEIRESLLMTQAGPKLLAPTEDLHPTYKVRKPLTPTLGLPIARKQTPHFEGTAGFFMVEGGESKRLFLITARHVLFELKRSNNQTYQYPTHDAPRQPVILLGNEAFTKLLESVDKEIRRKDSLIDYHQRRTTRFKNDLGDGASEMLQTSEDALNTVRRTKASLTKFFSYICAEWTQLEKRVLGHIIYSPPLHCGFGPRKYTQDFAVIEIDTDKISSEFYYHGNVIDLRGEIEPDVFIEKMYPNLKNPPSFIYPEDGLLRLRGTIPDQEIYNPPAWDQYGEPCLMVIKDGCSTGVTIGRANNVRSCVRNYYNDDITESSMEWAILSFDKRFAPFSAPGDSGACVSDGRGRIGGIITGGCGLTPDTDITYVSNIHSIIDGIKQKYPSAHLFTCHHSG